MKILIVGDIVGRPGRNILQLFLEKNKNNYDFIIVNGENAAGGFGITPKIADEFFEWGVDIISGGNHSWDKKEFYEYLDNSDKVLRPHNYPDDIPGKGYSILEDKNGNKIAVISVQGRTFMTSVNCPFRTCEKLIEEIKITTKNIIIDFHAEATSEKIALARFLDGEVSVVYGTHTHVQTAKADIIIKKFLTSLPQKFEIAEGEEELNGIEVEIDSQNGKCKNIKRLNWSENEGFRS